ncbi:MAG: PorV/PorQ family protein, partial [Bacteroidetes bacterium]|nr:PorV/PorQ family protein [Bacteroidota bacterium]
MGESGVSTANDANAIYWNPGAIGFIATPENPRNVQFMHVNWLPQFNLSDVFYDYGSFIWYMPEFGTFGFNFTFLNLGEQDATDALGNPNGKITSYDFSIGASYGLKLTEDLGVGGNLKFIYSKLADKSVTLENENGIGSSVAVDIGVMKRNFFFKNLTAGASLANIGPEIAYADEKQSDPLPTNLRAGLSYPVYSSEYHNILVAYEINRQIVRGRKNGSDPLYKAVFTTWADNGWHRLGHNFGAEYSYSDFVALRSGYSLDFAGKVYDLNFGAGLKYSLFRVDFAYTTKLGGGFNPRDGSQFYSIGLSF